MIQQLDQQEPVDVQTWCFSEHFTPSFNSRQAGTTEKPRKRMDQHLHISTFSVLFHFSCIIKSLLVDLKRAIKALADAKVILQASNTAQKQPV